jgi:hypothetical protein
MGEVALALEIEPSAALAVLRATAYGSNRTAEEVAADLLEGRLAAADLRPPVGGD